jgi:hypothetical protein
MGPLVRIVLNTATALSLLLWAAVAVVVFAVYFSGDRPKLWTWQNPDGQSVRLELATDRVEWTRTRPVTSIQTEDLSIGWFIYYFTSVGGDEHVLLKSSHLELNTGPIFLASLVIPAVRLVSRQMRKRRHRVGYCFVCGYDLRATPDRCPECGAVPGRFRQQKLRGRTGRR